MAKVRGPLLSADAKGTLADILTYQGGFGGHRVTKKPLHRDMQSVGQMMERLLFLAGRDEWKELTDNQKAIYDATAHLLKMTGYNYVVSEFRKGNIEGALRLLLLMQEGSGAKVYDRSGYGNDGDIEGASWVQLASGLWVLSFDGTDDYVEVNSNVCAGLLAVTLMLWVKPTDNSANYSFIGDYEAEADVSCSILGLDQPATSTWNLTFDIKGENSAKGTFNGDTLAISYGAWHFVVGTWDGSYVNLCLDGVPDMTPGAYSDTALEDTVTHNTTIGAYQPAAGKNTMLGPLALVRIYSRALSITEIRNYYNRTKHLFGV